MSFVFTPAHRGGAGPPLVCLHGFTGTWRVWDLVLPRLERRHDVLAVAARGRAHSVLLPWPASAARYGERLPHADWVVLDDVGHCPQLDVPLETAELILAVSAS